MSDRTETALRRAIVADPDDDLVRHAYADFREEAGDLARARYIRWSLGSGDGRTPPCRWRQWFQPWWRGKAICHSNCHSDVHGRGHNIIRQRALQLSSHLIQVRRGFPHTLDIPERVWLDSGPRLCREWPLRRVEIHHMKPGLVPSSDETYWTPLAIGETQPSMHYDVPPEIYRHLEDHAGLTRRTGIYDTTLVFGGHRKAIDALSDAALKWAWSVEVDGH